ncbi:CRISPR-associated endoribonuclease Cse3 [compost metagenome]
MQSKALPESFLDHARYRFKVIINPTRRDSASGRLLPVKGRHAIAHWFRERASANWGFQVDAELLQVDRLEVLQFKDKQQRQITLAQAHIQGQLQVSDPQRFRNSFSHGIGRGRAFGCGLLQIVPLYDNPFA